MVKTIWANRDCKSHNNLFQINKTSNKTFTSKTCWIWWETLDRLISLSNRRNKHLQTRRILFNSKCNNNCNKLTTTQLDNTKILRFLTSNTSYLLWLVNFSNKITLNRNKISSHSIRINNNKALQILFKTTKTLSYRLNKTLNFKPNKIFFVPQFKRKILELIMKERLQIKLKTNWCNSFSHSNQTMKFLTSKIRKMEIFMTETNQTLTKLSNLMVIKIA